MVGELQRLTSEQTGLAEEQVMTAAVLAQEGQIVFKPVQRGEAPYVFLTDTPKRSSFYRIDCATISAGTLASRDRRESTALTLAMGLNALDWYHFDGLGSALLRAHYAIRGRVPNTDFQRVWDFEKTDFKGRGAVLRRNVEEAFRMRLGTTQFSLGVALRLVNGEEEFRSNDVGVWRKVDPRQHPQIEVVTATGIHKLSEFAPTQGR